MKQTTGPAWPPEIPGRADWDDFMSANNTESGVRFWLPNHGDFGHRLSETDHNEHSMLTAESVADSLSAARAAWSEYLAAAEHLLGVKLEVEYAVVPYYC
jgi:hypothetical protein